MYSAILLSGGKGCRMQEATPKQYLLLGGKPMIMHSLERIDSLKSIDEIILVCDFLYLDYLKRMLHEYNISTKIIFAAAGETRQESVYNGLQKANNEDVIIHEAARPFVKLEEFQRIIDADGDNVIYGYDIPYTIVKGKSVIEGILNRSELLNVQLPQKFKLKTLKEAYDKAIDHKNIYTEDASLMFANSNAIIKVIKGSSYNIKITEPIDLLLGEIIYKDYILNRK